MKKDASTEMCRMIARYGFLLLVWTTLAVNDPKGALAQETAVPSSDQANPVITVPNGANQVKPMSLVQPSVPRPMVAPPIGEERPSMGSETAGPGEYVYNPSGRREPFAAIVKDGHQAGENDLSLPPLQRIALTELNLIGIIWGGFGYSAMVQAPDGKGYAVRHGTRIGPNNGVVSSITENAIVVQERYTDVFGNRQVREYVKLLHAKEGSE